MASTINFVALNFILKAGSKDTVKKLFDEAFFHRHEVILPEGVVNQTAQTLGINPKDAKELLKSLCELVKAAIYQGSSDPTEVLKLFPANFHKNLRDLLSKIIIEKVPQWKTHCSNTMVSLPRLVDFDWRVDMKTSSDAVSRTSVPTCVLQLQVQENATEVGRMPAVSSHNVELSKETLDTILDGLGKIRDQLNSVAKRS